MAKKKVVKKKKIAKKKKSTAKKKTSSKKKPASRENARPIGTVTHFYNEIRVAIVKFNKKVPVGTALNFKGATTDFTDTPKSMQYEHKPITAAPKGKQIGIKVKKRVREGDLVYKSE
jgi:hypothetical protein